jgi:hypothetical protein
LKRPEQHVTDGKANAIFLATFSEWAVNSSQQDYGWDYVVEVFRDGISTGLLFSAQLKGSLHTKYSSDATFISQPLEREAAEYLARELQQPTFLFHADVNTDQLFWSAIQLDQSVSGALTRGETQSLTVRIPTANVLPQNMGSFLGDLVKCQTVVVSRILLNIKAADFVEAMRGQPTERIARVAEDLHEKGFRLDLDAAHILMRGGNLSGAIEAIRKVLGNSSGFLEIQFNATLQLGELETLELMKSDMPQSLAADRRLATAQELCRIARRVPKHLHLFAQATRKAAELGVAVQKVFGLVMIWQGHSRRGDDPVWLAVLSFQLSESLVAAHRRYRHSLRLAQAIARSRFRWITSRPLVDIALRVATLATVLESTGFKDAAREYHASALQLMKFAAAVATESHNIDDLFNAVTHARMLEKEKDGEVFLWIRSIIDQWPETSEYRKNAEELLRRWIARKEGATFEGDIETNYRQIHQNILTSAGIDPTKEPWATHIGLAIKDDDPTRVLKECQQKSIYSHPVRDRMLDRLGLERANPKIIRCELHRYKLDGLELDEIDERFKRRYCNACPDRVPRTPEWSFYADPTLSG